MKKSVYSLSVILAGCLWGTMGIFRRHMGDAGFSSLGIVFIRCFFACIFYAVTIAVTNPKAFSIRLKDLWVFICDGIVSVLFFSLCYFVAMNMTSLSIAAILLYTAPVFVILFSSLLFKEQITTKKVLAIIMAFAGCCLVSGIIGSGNSLTLPGFLFGLGAGIGYALYSIFSKMAMDRGYTTLTINFYAMGIAAIGAFLIEGTGPAALCFSSTGNAVFCIVAAIITTYLPYMLYTYGLNGVEPGKASVMASIEPVVATLVGYVVFRETLNGWSAVGICLVLAAVVVLNLNLKRRSA